MTLSINNDVKITKTPQTLYNEIVLLLERGSRSRKSLSMHIKIAFYFCI